MTITVWLGLGMTLVAGLLAGNSMLPMKFVKRWQWENTWLIFSLVSLVLIPWALGFALVDQLGALYASLPASDFAAPLLFGAGWGIAQVLFGLSIARLGLALGYAIIIALGAVLGTLVPLFVQKALHSQKSNPFNYMSMMFLDKRMQCLKSQQRLGQGKEPFPPIPSRPRNKKIVVVKSQNNAEACENVRPQTSVICKVGERRSSWRGASPPDESWKCNC